MKRKLLAFAVILSLGVICLTVAIGGFSLNRSYSFDEKRPDSQIVGVWIASVSNIDFPSSQALSEQELKSEIDAIMTDCSIMGVNTVFLQVRPTSDALYSSEIFPLSVFLTGGEQRMATSEDFDVLGYAIEVAHEKGIALHAWINPMRISSGTERFPSHSLLGLCEDNPCVRYPEYVVKSSNGCMYYDVGIPALREIIAAGVAEIVNNYDIDGIVFDDYFYPYGNASFDDSASYEQYGDGKTLAEFRRSSVTSLIKLCHEVIEQSGKSVLFGISPFGVWQHSSDSPDGSNTSGTSSYHDLYCDTLEFAEKGYVDYIAPQLYWNNEDKNTPYDELCEWWGEKLRDTGCALVVSHAAHKYEQWTDAYGTLLRQFILAKKQSNYRGSMFYGYSQIKQNLQGVRDEIAQISRYAK